MSPTSLTDMGADHDSVSPPSGSVRTKLACRQCQTRKIKCDRLFPCNHCRASGATCSHGVRKHRSGIENNGQGHRTFELRHRLERLESMMKKMSGEVPDTFCVEEVKPAGLQRPKASTRAANRYIASSFWTSLSGEVQALRDILEDDHDFVEETISSRNSLSTGAQPFSAHSLGQPTGSFDFIMCHPGRIYQLPGAVPGLYDAMNYTLLNTYIDYVDSCWKVFHVPTLRALGQEGKPYLEHDANTPCNRALLAAVHYGGVSQMSDKDCRDKFGQPRAELASHFGRIAEAALVQADLFNTTSLAALQAFAVYVATSRKHDSSHRSWALFGLLVRLAQALNVEEESLDETFFIQQLRRRLWHHILVLDSYFAFDRGSDVIVKGGPLQRPLPMNINDEDLFEYSTASTIELSHKRPTDMNYALQLHELYLVGDRLESLNGPIVPNTSERRMELTKLHHAEIETKYLCDCNPKDPFQRLTIKISKVIQALNALNCVRSFQRPFAANDHREDAPWILELALDILRKTEELYDDDLQPWLRLVWVQWHPLAIALGCLCNMTDSPILQEAWTVVDRAMEHTSSQVADGDRGRLWQPISRLYRRASATRNNFNTPPQCFMGDFDPYVALQDPSALSVSSESSIGGDLHFLSNPAIGSTDPSGYDLDDLFRTTWLPAGDLGQWQS